MAQAYVDGKLVEVSGPGKKYNKPAGPKIKKQYSTKATAEPKGSTTVGGKKQPKIIRASREPKVKPPKGFYGGGLAEMPNPALGMRGVLPSLNPASVSMATEVAADLTPEGFGPKAGFGNEQTPRDFNTYRGKLPFLGSFGAGIEKVAGDLGQVAGEISTHLPESLGGIKAQPPAWVQTPSGSYVKNANTEARTPALTEDQFQALKDQQYMDMFGVDQEGYGYLASGSEKMPTGKSFGAPPAEVVNQDLRGETFRGQSPITFTEDGIVKANRYGAPDRPDVMRRSLEERLGAVTGGDIPDSMEGFMVANFLQNQLRLDDSRRVGDAKDIYKADLSALPGFMQEDRLSQKLPAEIAGLEAQAGYNTALAGQVPSRTKLIEAQASQATAAAEAMPNKEESKMIEVEKKAMDNARALAIEQLKSAGITDASPEDIAAIQNVLYNQIMQGHAQTRKGKKAKLTPRTEASEGSFFRDPVPAIPYGVVYN